MAEESSTTMLAFCIENAGDSHGKVVRLPKPKLEKPGMALIRVLRAGVCNTDLEILQGYMGFQGVLGHEFVGIVEDVKNHHHHHHHEAAAAAAAAAVKTQWIGKRVCGDINVGCQDCPVCAKSLDDRCCQMGRNHCPNRTVLGILKRNGTMAEYLTLPIQNLHVVPDDMSDEVAVFSEPLAAACRIVEQGLVSYEHRDRVAILGDGKLGLMIAEVLGREHLKHFGKNGLSSQNNNKTAEHPPSPILFGKHQHKLDLVAESGVDGKLVSECQDSSAFNGVSPTFAGKFDVVVDATGSPAGLSLAAGLCRPMGTLVLKSTCAAGEQFNAAPFVIDELRVVGSRCGPIDQALRLLDTSSNDNDDMRVSKYITKTFPLAQAEEAIQCAAEKSTMKVQIICNDA